MDYFQKELQTVLGWQQIAFPMSFGFMNFLRLSLPEMNSAIISLGSNLGDRKQILEQAIKQTRKRIGKISATSTIIESKGIGNPHLADFLNMVIAVDTNLSAKALLTELLMIEAENGRIRTGKGYQNRTLDMDILFFNREMVSESGLEIPHPRLHEREFVLLPLCEILPNFIHPGFDLSISQLLKMLKTGNVLQEG